MPAVADSGGHWLKWEATNGEGQVKACGAALFVCALGVVPAAAGAQGCAGLAASVDDARKLLLRAANEPAFEAAKNRALRARDADSPNEYIDSLEAAIRAFNSAIGELKFCAAQRAR